MGIERKFKIFFYFVGILLSLSVCLYDRFNIVAFIVLVVIALSLAVLSWVCIYSYIYEI